MYRFCIYDLKVPFWWPNKCLFWGRSSWNTLYNLYQSFTALSSQLSPCAQLRVRGPNYSSLKDDLQSLRQVSPCAQLNVRGSNYSSLKGDLHSLRQVSPCAQLRVRGPNYPRYPTGDLQSLSYLNPCRMLRIRGPSLNGGDLQSFESM